MRPLPSLHVPWLLEAVAAMRLALASGDEEKVVKLKMLIVAAVFAANTHQLCHSFLQVAQDVGIIPGKPRVKKFYVQCLKVKADNYVDTQFKRRFALYRAQFDYLLSQVREYDVLNPECLTAHSRARPADFNSVRTCEAQLLIFLAYISSTMAQHDVSDMFGVDPSSVCRSIHRMCLVLFEVLKHDIVFPTTADEFENHAQRWQNINERRGKLTPTLHNVVAAFDGTHVRVAAPLDNTSVGTAVSDSFVDRKGDHSIAWQIGVGADFQILACFGGVEGRWHDTKMFHASGVLPTVLDRMPTKYHAIGDTGYPSSRRMLIPYKQPHQAEQLQGYYNYCHSSMRMVVECVIGLVKRRFQRLGTVIYNGESEPLVLLFPIACALHNRMLSANGLDDVYDNRMNVLSSSSGDFWGSRRTEYDEPTLVPDEEIDNESVKVADSSSARNKRLFFARYLLMKRFEINGARDSLG